MFIGICSAIVIATVFIIIILSVLIFKAARAGNKKFLFGMSCSAVAVSVIIFGLLYITLINSDEGFEYKSTEEIISWVEKEHPNSTYLRTENPTYTYIPEAIENNIIFSKFSRMFLKEHEAQMDVFKDDECGFEFSIYQNRNLAMKDWYNLAYEEYVNQHLTMALKSKIDSNLEMSSAHGLTVDGDNLIIYLWIDPNLPQETQDELADKVNNTGKIIDVLAEALNECDVKCIYPRNIDLKLYRVVMEG